MAELSPESVVTAVVSRQPGGTTRVLPTLGFALDYWWSGGLDPAAFKRTSVAVHVITIFVLSLLLRSIFLSAGWRQEKAAQVALLLAFIWAVHPLQVSSVLYVVQRMQTMGTLFLLLALLAYTSARAAQIEARPARGALMAVGLCWLLALGCKEDSALLPAYMLVLELTVFRFRAAAPVLARRIRGAYVCGAIVAMLVYFFLVIPHYWVWDSYDSRDFSTYERVLTQGRVLSMYIGQILIPLPQWMPFYYDWLQPSRGLLQPWTTLPAWLMLLLLLVSAVFYRTRRPLFAFGILLFFAGHFISSNVIGLELAFEHRNHFAMIGILVAFADLVVLCVEKQLLPFSRRWVWVVGSGALLLIMAATFERAKTWGDPLQLAKKSTELAPDSARAWNSLCLRYFNDGGGYAPENPNLDLAISACTNGGNASSTSIASLTNLLVFKTLRGDADKQDWDRFLDRLQRVPMTSENSGAIWVIIGGVGRGIPLDEDGVLRAIAVAAERKRFRAAEYAGMGYFIMQKTSRPAEAYPYFVRAVEVSPPRSILRKELDSDLRKQGRSDWADSLRAVN